MNARTLKYLFGLTFLALAVIGLPSLGARSLGPVGSWLWASFWLPLGVAGATALLVLIGRLAVRILWRRRALVDSPAGTGLNPAH